MNYFNSEEIDLLREYERYFYTSVKLKYKSATKHLFNLRLQEIYENHTGIKEKVNWSCPKCAFDYFKKVGQLYYDSIEHNKNNQSDRITSINTVRNELEPTLIINNLDQTVTNNETNVNEDAKTKERRTKGRRKGSTKSGA